MRAVLLSSGPSLAAFDDSTARDVTIAVNRAACRFACDWWSAGDSQTIRRHCADGPDFVIGTPKILTMSSMMDEVKRSHPDIVARHEWLTWEQMRDAIGPPEGWAQWSAPLGLLLCVHLGVSSVDVHGVDMAGDSDFTGERIARFSECRWRRERENWTMILRWVRRRGVAVNWTTERAVAA